MIDAKVEQDDVNHKLGHAGTSTINNKVVEREPRPKPQSPFTYGNCKAHALR